MSQKCDGNAAAAGEVDVVLALVAVVVVVGKERHLAQIFLLIVGRAEQDFRQQNTSMTLPPSLSMIRQRRRWRWKKERMSQ